MATGDHNPATDNPVKRAFKLETCLPLAILGISLLWVYLPTLEELIRQWSSDSHNTHGFLVPVFAAVLLWLRRDRLKDFSPRFSWWGVSLIVVGALFRIVAVYCYFDWLDAFSLIVCLAGIIVLFTGRQGLVWSWQALVFLIFMIPLPFRLQIALGFPLQRIATIASTYLLQTFGLPALAEGNTILLNDYHLGVVEACNGLGMMMVFFALSTGVVFLIDRPLWQKAFLLASAIPIAIASNVIRITLTGILYETVGGEVADFVFHDLAGYLMPLIALGFLWLELQGLSRLVIEVEQTTLQKVPSTVPAETNVSKEVPKPAKAKKKASPYAAVQAGLVKTKK